MTAPDNLTTTTSTMSTAPPDPTTAAEAPGSALAPISLDRTGRVVDTGFYTFFGTMFWIGPLWLLAVVANVIAVWAVNRWGTVEQSIWSGGFAGWQTWVFGGAGISASYYFVPMHVAFGVTRRVTAWGTAIGGAAIALCGALVTVAGFAVESWWLRGRGVTAWVDDAHTDTAATIGYPTILLAQLLVLLAAFGGGWALHAAAAAFGNVAYLALPVFLAPVAVTTLTYANRLDSGPFAIEFLRLDRPLAGFAISVATIVACWWAATVLTRRARI